MTDAELAAAAWLELKKTTGTYANWVKRGSSPLAPWGKAKAYLDQIVGGVVVDPPPPAASYLDNIGQLTAVFLPVYTLAPDIKQGVTNPSGLGGGIWEINDAAGSGFRFVCTSQMAAIWDSTAKACLAFADVRPGVGQYEQWNFKLRVPSADNPSFSGGFFAGTLFEFGHHVSNSGTKIEIDPRPGGEGFHVGVPVDFNNVGSFNYYKICDWSAFKLDHDYVVDARLRYNPDNTGYVRIRVDGVTIVDQSRPMRPNTSEKPKPQFGWYSDRAAAKNGVELRNIQYAYGV